MTDNDPSAPWERIRDDLIAGITDGRWAPGSALPPLSALTERYGVSRGPVQRAIAELRDTGVLRGVQGVSVYVVKAPDDVTTVEDRVTQLEETTASLDDRTGVLEAQLLEVLAHLGLPRPGETPSDRKQSARQGDVEGRGS